jgi:hypothetical protein
MPISLNLKNSEKKVFISEDIYLKLCEDEYLKSINFLQELRLHSNGYAFFQKSFARTEVGSKGGYITIYLHKCIAEKFLPKKDLQGKQYVMFKNGNRLDCRTENLEWTSRGQITSTTRKNSSLAGYKGVYRDGENYRATIYINGLRHEIGSFPTYEEAADAYRKTSMELLGIVKNG